MVETMKRPTYPEKAIIHTPARPRLIRLSLLKCAKLQRLVDCITDRARRPEQRRPVSHVFFIMPEIWTAAEARIQAVEKPR